MRNQTSYFYSSKCCWLSGTFWMEVSCIFLPQIKFLTVAWNKNVSRCFFFVRCGGKHKTLHHFLERDGAVVYVLCGNCVCPLSEVPLWLHMTRELVESLCEAFWSLQPDLWHAAIVPGILYNCFAFMLILEYTRREGSTRPAALMQVTTVTSESLSADNAAVYRLRFSQTTLHTLAARLIEQPCRSNAVWNEPNRSEGPEITKSLRICSGAAGFAVTVDDGCGFHNFSWYCKCINWWNIVISFFCLC